MESSDDAEAPLSLALRSPCGSSSMDSLCLRVSAQCREGHTQTHGSHSVEDYLSNCVENIYHDPFFFLSLDCNISKKLIFPKHPPTICGLLTTVILSNVPPLYRGRLTEYQEENWPSQWQDIKEKVHYCGVWLHGGCR